MRVVDFRSDTVTLPSPQMRQAMAEAELGDDVYGEDPTVNKLEAMAAEMLGKEAAVLVVSGTMGNLVSVLAHCQRGDEIVLGDQAHIFRNEAGGASALGGVSYNPVPTAPGGKLDPDVVEAAIRPQNLHYARTALVALENTHNASGGSVLTPEDTKAVADVAHRHGIPLHIDGARIFNAAVCLETPVAELAKDADSVTFCLSKGLACPVGSVICGSNEFVQEARRWRKMVGGGMRQAGVIAAAGVVALETMVDRLAEDHANGRRLAEGLAKVPGIKIEPDKLPTNLIRFEVTAKNRASLAQKLAERGVKGGSPYGGWRFVTHYGITADDVDYALDVVESVFKQYAQQ
jgi:threonine aldolase